jgi:tRNA nucleotidyltransferase/poly(A) polymerase
VSAAITAARAALRGAEAWVVGGAVRDALLGRATADVDLVVRGDPRAAARALARAAGGPVFPLSDAFGAWRVLAPDQSWQADLNPLRGATLEDDLALRDLTVNAIAEPLAGDGERVDPFGGVADLAARRLRAVGPRSLHDDPLRVVRVARLHAELGLAPDDATIALARDAAPGLRATAAERVFAELKRIVVADEVLRGLRLLERLGAAAVVLPELEALRGVEQNRYHHLDVHGHTLEVLEHVVALQRDPAPVVGEENAAGVLAVLAEPLADELDRGAALRLGALLHDAAKPATRVVGPGGDVLGFPRHDAEGAELTDAALARLRASSALRAHVAALARHHLRLGFLVHEQPLEPRALYAYLVACEPVEVDVTLLSVADRLATRGRKAQESIARHLELARPVLAAALAWRAVGGRPAPLLRGDELAAAAEIRPGPQVGRLLAALSEAQYAGEVRTREEALRFARERVGGGEG